MTANIPWYDDDAFWEALEPFMFSEEAERQAPADVEGLVGLLEPQPQAKILDLGCGIGRHSLALARRGYQVTGLDRTARYLDTARERLRKEGIEVEYILGDMREYVRPDSFDCVVSLYTSGLSYFPDPDSDRQVVANVLASLKSGGRFVLHTKGKEVLARIYVPRDWREKNGVFFLQERKIDNAWSWMDNRWIFIRDGRAQEYHVTHRIYSAVELCGLIRDCGFSGAAAYGDFRGNPYGPNAQDLVVVATK